MRNFREKVKIYAERFAAMSFAVYCVFRTKEAGEAVSQALERCIYVLIPSLYAMLIVTGLLMESGLARRLPKPAAALGRAIFGTSAEETSVFLFSMAAGYPIGARMLCTGGSDKRRAEPLAGVCFGAGPAFIFGCISQQIYGSDAVGRLILLSNITANALLAVMMRFFIQKSAVCSQRGEVCGISGKMLADCISTAGTAMARMCLAVMAFSVLTAALGAVGITSFAGALLARLTGCSRESGEVIFRSMLDVTSLTELQRGDYTLLPWISALASFGGACVLFQIFAVTSGKLRIAPIAVMRVLAAALSYLICRAAMPIMLRAEAVSVSTANVRSCREKSPVPSVMLIIMTLMVIVSAERIKKGSTKCSRGAVRLYHVMDFGDP